MAERTSLGRRLTLLRLDEVSDRFESPSNVTPLSLTKWQRLVKLDKLAAV